MFCLLYSTPLEQYLRWITDVFIIIVTLRPSHQLFEFAECWHSAALDTSLPGRKILREELNFHIFGNEAPHTTRYISSEIECTFSQFCYPHTENSGLSWYFSSSPLLSVGFSIQLQEAHFYGGSRRGERRVFRTEPELKVNKNNTFSSIPVVLLRSTNPRNKLSLTGGQVSPRRPPASVHNSFKLLFHKYFCLFCPLQPKSWRRTFIIFCV